MEHNTENPSAANNSQRSHRPDLSTFFATLSEITPNPAETRTREHAVPVPGDVSAAFRTLAEAFDVMRRDYDIGGAGSATGTSSGGDDHHGGELIDQMIEALIQGAEMPPREVEGVTEEFCDGTCLLTVTARRRNAIRFDINVVLQIIDLDRIPRSALKPSQSCPICSNAFLDDPYPLVVRLPCHHTHLFDMECIRPWLRLRGTCPLDRTDFGKKQRERELERRQQLEKRRAAQAAIEEDDEEWDGMYG